MSGIGFTLSYCLRSSPPFEAHPAARLADQRHLDVPDGPAVHRHAAAGTDNSNTGLPSIGFGVVDRPNVTGDPNLSDRSPEHWFNTSAFVKPPFASFGNAGRNIVEGPGFASVNVSLIKNTAIAERATVQFRAEIFNLLDRANFGLPDGFFGSPSFGSILTAGAPRRVQFGLKLLF